jgi:hypothetical protein
MSSTTLLLKKGAKHVRFYSPVTLRGVLWVCSGVTVALLKSLLEWKAAGVVTEMDIKIMWATVAAVAVDKWLTYIDTTFARFKDEKKKRDETEAFAKSQDGQTAAEGHLR